MKIDLHATIKQQVNQINQEVISRSYRAANVLRNSALDVLKGTRSGRVYRMPHSNSYYRASAPGEPPATRSGQLRESWASRAESEKNGGNLTVNPAISTDIKYAPKLQDGTSKMNPRPYKDPIIEHAKPKIKQIFQEPF